MEQECYATPNAEVTVKGVIYPGALIKIKNSSTEIKEKVSG